MSIEALRDQLPEYAKDIKLNLGSLAGETVLNDQQKWGTLLSCAIASGNATVIKAIAADAESKLSPEALRAAKGAAVVMGMNNVYYRFTHLVSEKTYQTMPAKLRMQIIGSHGIDKTDFELWCLAVSAINGCGMCMDNHEAVARKGGMTSEMVQASIRIASTVNAAAAAMNTEEALA